MVLITCLIDDPWLSAGVGTLKCLLPVLDYWSFWSYRWHTQNIKLKTVQWRHIWGQGWQTPLPRLAQSSALSNTGQVECRLERYPLYTLFLYYGTYDYYNSLIMYSLHQILNSLRAETMSSKFIFLPSAHRWSSIHVWIKDHMGGLFFFLKKTVSELSWHIRKEKEENWQWDNNSFCHIPAHRICHQPRANCSSSLLRLLHLLKQRHNVWG